MGVKDLEDLKGTSNGVKVTPILAQQYLPPPPDWKNGLPVIGPTTLFGLLGICGSPKILLPAASPAMIAPNPPSPTKPLRSEAWASTCSKKISQTEQFYWSTG